MLSRLSFALGLTISLIAADHKEGPPDEYQVKAAFLYNFAKFVEWPPEAFENQTAFLTVCVLGADPFGHALDDVLDGKKIEKRAFAVRRISDARQTKGCRILFVGPAEHKNVLAGIDKSGVLTVGESDSAVSEGMIINFTLEAGKVRFAINRAEAERQKLRLSSRLLSLATAVKK